MSFQFPPPLDATPAPRPKPGTSIRLCTDGKIIHIVVDSQSTRIVDFR